jgi:DUF4097 and DUF4098 domain-containing protein YvlB
MIPRYWSLPFLLLSFLLPACRNHETSTTSTGKSFEGKYEIEKTFALDFQVDDELEMDTSTGALRVFPLDEKGPRIESKVSVFAKSDVEAQAVAERVQISIIKHGQTHRPKLNKDSSDTWNPRHVLAVSYTAYVPAGTSIRMRNIEGIHEVRGPFRGIYLSSRHGDIHLQDAEGPMRLTTRHGKITMRNIVGEEIEADTWSGKVDLTMIEARNLTVRTRDGDIRMEGVQAQKILTRSSYGEMELSGIKGDLVAQNKNGKMEIIGLTAGRHELSTTNGDVQIQGATGELEIRTTTAMIRIDDFRGEADLESRSGDILASGRFGQLRCSTKSGKIRARTEAGSTANRDWRFTSQFGEISLGLRQAFPCILALSTDTGILDNRLALTKILSRDSTSLRGQIGIGGQVVHLSSDKGRVEVFSLATPSPR